MNWIDIAILITIFFTTLIGFKIGLIRSAFLLGSFLVAIVVTPQLAGLFDEYLKEAIDEEKVRYAVSFGAAFIILLLGVNLLGVITYRLVKYTPLRWVDQWIGVALGFLAGIIIVGIIIMYLTDYPLGDSKKWLRESFTAPIVQDFLSQIIREFMEKDYTKLMILQPCFNLTYGEFKIGPA
ncbi:hypothetical protein GF312_06425 [Candidatus Poribacteria bacterium]|nr:hypothetical protein [Candidatus Poribacteria bacterium]